MPRRTKSDELLDFEIAFYEKLLRAYPDFVDALTPLAEAYTRRGLYERGLAVDLRLIHLRGSDSLAWYNLACSYSLLRRLDEAIESLRRALELGYEDMVHLRSDPDLINLRHYSPYRKLLESFAMRLLPSPSPAAIPTAPPSTPGGTAQAGGDPSSHVPLTPNA